MTLTLINRYARSPAETGDESFTDLGLDALDLMCIANALEHEFGKDISDAEIERWHSVSCVLATVERVRG